MSTDTNKCPTQHMVGPAPGPWTLSETASRCIIGRAAHGRMSICVMQNTQSEHYAANARLIAAAPELLESLKLYLATYADTQTHPMVIQEAYCIGVARAAVAKAIGAEGKV